MILEVNCLKKNKSFGFIVVVKYEVKYDDDIVFVCIDIFLWCLIFGYSGLII